MMAAARAPARLIERLPPLRGRLSEDAPLHRIAWFRVGGPAEVLFEPADRDDLADLLGALPAAVPVTVIGVASNLLIRDGGVPGVVVRLGRRFSAIRATGDEISAGAGALAIELARACRDAEIAGLEFLSGIPGTVGGALRMNAGAYGREVKDVIASAEALARDGTLHRPGPAELDYGYRRCGVPGDWIFTAGVFRGRPGTRAEIARRMAEISREREDSQPIRTRTGGSTFVNPPDHKAWELIERAGCRGLRRGDAMVSDKHCNFLVNTGRATAADLEELGEEVRRRVREATGVALDWEIRRIGTPGGGGRG